MIVLPAPPPKDYDLDDINKSLVSSHLFTPCGEPRITFPTIAKQCVPIPYREDEEADLSKVPRKKPHRKILEKLMFDEKYSWVTTQGKDDFLIHDMFKKYAVASPIYDPRFMHKEKIFNRSCQYEVGCMDDLRLEKLHKKNIFDEKVFEYHYRKLLEKENAKRPPAIYIRPCKEEPPFWWPLPPDQKVEKKEFKIDLEAKEPPRYFEEPNLTAIVRDDPCKRKKDMSLVGRSFKHHACLWYFEKYPPPNIKFRPKRLGQ